MNSSRSGKRPNSSKPVAVIGGGPAGSVAALCLRKLGREVVLFERETFPRYHVGESLLPGTMSILERLGVMDRIVAAGFVKKRAATFLWGGDRAPWSFTFSAPKTTPWVFDHGFQVDRRVYDKILLDAARERGSDVREAHEVTGIEINGGLPAIGWKNSRTSGGLAPAFVIDASGSRGLLATAGKWRQYDDYFRNIAVWSYFRGGKPLEGDLEGNIISISFGSGWIWLIPLSDDRYSVGVVTGIESAAAIQELGKDGFYRSCLKSCPQLLPILEQAERCDETRIIRDWSYQSRHLSLGRAFICGDAACFIDPLFSQGVHLATYSAMLASAAIDRLYDHPHELETVQAWYESSYREAYNRYHKFVAAFYAANQSDSPFWVGRKIHSARDARFNGIDWFTSMTGQSVEADAEGVKELEQGAAILARLWEHNGKGLNDRFDEQELSLRRVKWVGEILADLKALSAIQWSSPAVRLVHSYKVHPISFKLERQSFLGDGNGRCLTAYPATEAHRELFENLIAQPKTYRELAKSLSALPTTATPMQLVIRLIEDGFLQCYDKAGQPHRIPQALRFGGVGAGDDLS